STLSIILLLIAQAVGFTDETSLENQDTSLEATSSEKEEKLFADFSRDEK
ncbi:9856_t:CDS:2, partial [Dentiscutata heterogama]